VGIEPGVLASKNAGRTWTLPRALISHYTSTLAETCDREGTDPHEFEISLLQDDPVIFELFVQWLYHGIYILSFPLPATNIPGVSRDAQAWVLGHNLKSVGFKNYVMTRLYAQYGTTLRPKPVTTDDVDYVFKHSAPDSKLYKFFQDFLVVNFSTANCTKGTTVLWDSVLHAHPTPRLAMLKGMRYRTSQPQNMSPQEAYMDTEEASPSKKNSQPPPVRPYRQRGTQTVSL
jgi:hypothetical protein